MLVGPQVLPHVGGSGRSGEHHPPGAVLRSWGGVVHYPVKGKCTISHPLVSLISMTFGNIKLVLPVSTTCVDSALFCFTLNMCIILHEYKSIWLRHFRITHIVIDDTHELKVHAYAYKDFKRGGFKVV